MACRCMAGRWLYPAQASGTAAVWARCVGPISVGAGAEAEHVCWAGWRVHNDIYVVLVILFVKVNII